MAHDYDFVIIGSGFGGSVSALRLSEKGYRVAVLEAGKRYTQETFASTNWNVFKYLWLPQLRCFGIMRVTPLSDVMILSGTGVGGGSLGYACTLLVPPEPYFKDPQWADMADWQDVLAPHFETAKTMLGVVRNEHVSDVDKLVKEIAEESGCGDTFKMQDVGIYFGEPEKTVPDPYFEGEGPERTGCHLCGGCMVGCRHGAKNTLDMNYLYLAEKKGVQVIPETTATLIREQEDGSFEIDTKRTTSWFGGGKRTFSAKQVIVSAGMLGTMKLLFTCREQGALTKLSPALGTRARTNSEALSSVTARGSDIEYSKGIAITSSYYPDDHTHVEPVRYPRGSDLMNYLLTAFTEGGTPLTRPLRWLGQLLRHPIDTLRVNWPFGWAYRTIILLVMQTLDNSIRIFHRRRWWWPFSRMLVTEREDQHARIPAELPQAQEATKALAKRMDGIPQNAATEVLLNMGSTAHILGGCPIGPDAEHGVIDGHNKAYGYDGLYVIDGSMVPANLGVNPSLTITAMAEHAMSHIPAKNADADADADADA